MYPAANTVIRNPMPQTTQSITALRGSNSAPAVAMNVSPAAPVAGPVGIQVNQSFATKNGKPSSTVLSIPKSSQNDMTAEMPTPIQIGQWDWPFRYRAPKKPA